MAKKKSPPAAKKPSSTKPPAKKPPARKPPAKKGAKARKAVMSSAGGGLELTITTPHKQNYGLNNNITIQGTLSSPSVTLNGWLVTTSNVDPTNVTAGTTWSITFPGQATAGTYAAYARASQSGHAAVDQILVVVS
jgi:hypothetical protein